MYLNNNNKINIVIDLNVAVHLRSVKRNISMGSIAQVNVKFYEITSNIF